MSNNSFFESQKQSISQATQLAMAEALYGMLCKKDLGNGVIHSSDFRKSVVDLGLPLGHAIVEDILVFCKIDQNHGTMNFSELEAELKRRRYRFNKDQNFKRAKAAKLADSSVVSTSTDKSDHWRAQEEHNKRHVVAKYEQNIRRYRSEINELYRKFAHHELSAQDILSTMKNEYKIEPNKHFEVLLEDHKKGDDLTFQEFFHGLFKFNPGENIDEIRNRAAGSTNAGTGLHHMTKTEENITYKPIRRSNLEARTQMQARSNADGARSFSGRKEAIMNDMNPSGDAALFKNSTAVKRALALDNTDGDMMMTHNQRQMVKGAKGEDVQLTFNVEMKLLREQVLAGLRKLDSGEFKLSDFQSKIYDLGIEMEPVILKTLQDNLKAGAVNWRLIIHLFDATVFRKKALYDRPPAADVERIKAKMVKLMHSHNGFGAFVDLIDLFHAIDEDGNNTLSFFEFKKAMQEHGGLMKCPECPEGMTLEELRVLFHALDLDGNGTLDIYEFARGLREDVSGERLHLVRLAFRKLDITGSGELSVEDVVSNMHSQFHPDVTSGLKDEDEVRNSMAEFLQLCAMATNDDPDVDPSKVTYAQFLEYWVNLSSGIESDIEFETVIQQCMGFDKNVAPRPALAMAKKTAELTGQTVASDATQIHGDIIGWKQQASEMEEKATAIAGHRSSRRASSKLQGATDLRYHNQINIFEKKTGKADAISKQGSPGGHTHARQVMLSSNDTSTLTFWDTSKKGIKKQKEESSKRLADTLSSMTVSSSRIASQEMKVENSKDDFGEIQVPAGAPSGLFTVADSDSLARTRKRNEEIAGRNYGGTAPWLTPQEDAKHSLAYKINARKKDIKPLHNYVQGFGVMESGEHGAAKLNSIEMDTRREGENEEALNTIFGTNERSHSTPQGASPSKPRGPQKKAVSLMDMAEGHAASAGSSKSLTLAEMYGM